MPAVIIRRHAATVCLVIFAGAAFAADPPASASAQTRYEQERAACMAGTTGQDRDACLREAGAALQRAKRGYAEDAPSDVAANRLKRCDVQPVGAARDECVRRMNEGTVTGSVSGGGTVREYRSIDYGK